MAGIGLRRDLEAPALDGDVMAAFLERIPAHEAAVAGYSRRDNNQVLALVDQLLEDVAGRRAA